MQRYADAQAGLIDIDQCRDAGLSDRQVATRVERGDWLRITRRVYDTATVPLQERLPTARRLRAAWAAMLAFGPQAVAVGPCALALLGVQGLPTCITPQAALPGASNRLDRDGIKLRQFDDGLLALPVAGRLVAAPDWALAQAVPELPRQHALAVLDSSLHLGLLDRRELDRSHDRARGRRGVATKHDLWALADGRAESPLETFGRLDCIDAGVPPTTLQLPIYDSEGRLVARGDLGWELGGGRWLVAEMDGKEFHSDPLAVYADRHRQNLVVSTRKVDILRFTAADLPGGVGACIRRALGR